jgi:hypothetical protein
MIINDKRALAYVVTVDEIKPIDGYDRVEYARTNGWWVIISKNDNIQVGDKCVYFEVDSKVNASDERFAFLEKRNYKIKTQKMCKVISQGLLMPLRLFPELGDINVNTDVTDQLKVTYAVEEDNARKSNADPKAKYRSMTARHAKLFKQPWARWFMRREWGRKLMFLFFGKKKDNPRSFPTFISKTDEERVENQPWRIGDGKTYLCTEKLDGTSCTYALERKGKKKFEFYVCSRNVRQQDEKQECYHDHNIYWDLAFKYDIERHLRAFLNDCPELKWVCIQGEGVGSVQGNPLKLAEDDLYVFNFKDSSVGRYPSNDGKDIIELWGMKWVPILGEVQMPDTMEELKELATGKSVVNPNVMREGLVYRSLDGSDSFKNVSREYLLKHGQ